MRRLPALALTLGLVLATFIRPAPPSVAATGLYTITDLGSIGGTWSAAFAINASGQVAGTAQNANGIERAFLYSGGVMKDLGGLSEGAPSRVDSTTSINSLGQVVGESSDGSGGVRAVLWTSDGGIVDIGTLGGSSGEATGINDSGQVTGWADIDQQTRHVFLWTSSGGMVDLGVPAGADRAEAWGINSSGQVTGRAHYPEGTERAFLSSNGTLLDIGALGGNYSAAWGINDAGDVVGWSRVSSANTDIHAFLYSGGVMTNLGTLPGDNYSESRSVNNKRQVVGYSKYNDPWADDSRAFLWQNGTMIDLNVLLPANSGWLLKTAWAINDSGQIVGVGNLNGQMRAYLLTPPADTQPPVTSGVVASPNPAQVNTNIDLSATVDDTQTGGSNIASAEYRIDGGAFVSMSPVDGAFDSPEEAVMATIGSYATPGVHELCVSGSDTAGNVGQEQCTLLAVFDPNGGFVTGAGIVDSPAGAYTADPTLEGKAVFAFNSKYKPGATTPDGNTRFMFKAANLTFESTNYEWLVVSGAMAQYKGAGSLNGVPGYNFLLTARDGDLIGGGTPDGFRIKITDASGVVYDNMIGNSDDMTFGNTEAISGGSIVIHK